MAKPSAMSKPGFFALRFFQLLFTVPALALVAYFQYSLLKDDYNIPWEFIVLDLAAVATIINALLTSLLLCCRGVNPLFIIITDGGILTFLWAFSMGSLLKALGHTTIRTCTTTKWGNKDGVRVCQMYKALVAMVVMSFIITLAIGFFAVFARKSGGGSHQYAPALNPNSAEAKTGHLSTMSTAGMLGFQQKPGHQSAMSMNSLSGHSYVDTSYGGAAGHAAPAAAHSSDAGREPYAHVNPDYHGAGRL